MRGGQPARAHLCNNCPFRISSPKAGEPGGTVPVCDAAQMRELALSMTEGLHVMQCHKSSDKNPRPCAGFLSVVGYESIGVRLAVNLNLAHPEDVGRPIPGLYKSLREMLAKADHIDIGD